MKNDIFNLYKTMPELHKNNLENYLICHGIYSTFPDISDKDAEIIYEFCIKNKNENTNVYRLSSYLTNEFINGTITESDLKMLENREVEDLPFYDNLNHFIVSENDLNLEDFDK